MEFFLLTATPGFWVPVLSNVLRARGFEGVAMWAFFIIPVAAVVSPLLFGARADQRFRAERLLGVIMTGGAVFLFLAFWFLEHGEGPGWFLFFLGVNALVASPAWALLNTVALKNLEDPERQFGSYRVWGTLGWMMAGWVVSLLALDASPKVGQIASGIRLVAGGVCFLLPATPPGGEREFGWKNAVGLGSLRVLRDRDQGTYFLTAFLFMVPLTAFYLHTPLFLRDLGWERVAVGMSVGQMTEVAAMLVMGMVMVRLRIKWILLGAIAFGVMRYAIFAAAGVVSSAAMVVGAVALHGVCWTFFFESGRIFVDRRVAPGVRAQSQALLTLATGGLGGIFGTLTVGLLHRWLVLAEGAPGWTVYWLVLTGLCLGSGVLFGLGYRGVPSSSPSTDQ